MLREIPNITQNSTTTLRRWFSDQEFDLIVWHDRRDGRLLGFQLCYDLHRDEHVLTWHEDRGFAHNRVDSGEDSPVRNMTPILIADGLFERDRVRERFAERSQDIDSEVRALVLDRLAHYEVAPPGGQGAAAGRVDGDAASEPAGEDRSSAQRTVDES